MKTSNKKINKALLFSLALFLGISMNTSSQTKQILLWDNVPNSIDNKEYTEEPRLDAQGNRTGIKKVTAPTITPYLVNNNSNNNSAVVICPGGGYSVLAFDKEGIKIAKYFNTIGVSAFVLKYRLPSTKIMKNKTIGPLQDAQEAMRTIRRNAKKWHINPHKIGIMGFSAGGHLAATLSTHYDEPVYQSDSISAKPDFSILIYPVISMKNNMTHKGSRSSLLGKNPSQELMDHYSNETQINADTPPTFLVHATNDYVVPVENTIEYYLALKRNKVRAEMHVYEKGGHGFGLGTGGTHLDWPKSLKNWLNKNKLTN